MAMLQMDELFEKTYGSDISSLTVNQLVRLILDKRNENKADEIVTDENGFFNNGSRFNCAEQFQMEYGLSQKDSQRLLAAMELGKRMVQAETLRKTSIHSPEDAANLMMPRLRYEPIEHFQVILLNSKGKAIKIVNISTGSLNASVVHPREAFSPAIVNHAAAIVAVHNHPSGDPTPSREDRDLTQRLLKSGEILGIPMVDHIIIGDSIYYSFKEHGLI